MDKLTKEAIEEFEETLWDCYAGSFADQKEDIKKWIVKWLSKAFKAGLEEGFIKGRRWEHEQSK